MIELERTFLAQYIPKDLRKDQYKEYEDIYIPVTASHAHLRLRRIGEAYEMTKKMPIGTDNSEMLEQTIELDEEEYKALLSVEGKRIHKLRYLYPLNGQTAEIDIFQDALAGLVLVDFEFQSSEEKNTFTAPDFCLADVTQEEFIAGGYLCGKTYANIQARLELFNYHPLLLK